MQFLTLATIAISALSGAMALPQGPGRGNIGNVGSGNSRAGATGPINNNNGNQNGNNANGNTGSNVVQGPACGNGAQMICCNGPTTNTAQSNSGRLSIAEQYVYQALLRNIFASSLNAPTSKTTTSNQCDSVTTFDGTSSNPVCQQTVACCSSNQGPAVANVGCTVVNVNAGGATGGSGGNIVPRI